MRNTCSKTDPFLTSYRQDCTFPLRPTSKMRWQMKHSERMMETQGSELCYAKSLARSLMQILLNGTQGS